MSVLSRRARITLLLIIDVCFFFVELIAGYAVGSLALVADAFHMLNDVLSLVVALYAIKLAGQESDHRYTYGWHRAEILAALINGVFLLALCFSISIEAIERFFETPEISSPKLVVIVGSLGLLSNIVGLFLFHEHGHSHGHDHDEHEHSKHSHNLVLEAGTPVMEDGTTSSDSQDRTLSSPQPNTTTFVSRERSDSLASLYGHPAATRAAVVQTANDMGYQAARSPSPARHSKHRSLSRTPRASMDRSSFDASPSNVEENGGRALSDVEDVSEGEERPSGSPVDGSESTPLLQEHHHSSNNSIEHSHGSMNMHALLLHVLGDALGNVGVIATGLVIWFTEWRFKYYFDPVISLVITIIIFSSALPLVRSASFILLQGVPSTISLEDVRKSILSVSGVLSVHELHIWQLSEQKVVASVHVNVSRQHDFMAVAAHIRKLLHHRGIHSSTIQPEYHQPNAPPDDYLKTTADSSCLIVCPPDQACSADNACCPPPPAQA